MFKQMIIENKWLVRKPCLTEWTFDQQSDFLITVIHDSKFEQDVLEMSRNQNLTANAMIDRYEDQFRQDFADVESEYYRDQMHNPYEWDVT